MSVLLRQNGYSVVTASSKAEALEMCEHQTFDLLVADIGLPDGDGCELMREVAEKCHLKGIALTGYGYEKDIKRALESGFSSHLLKPIELKDLLKAIQDAMPE
jgi:CheY-like chemotaxis protein